MAVRLAPVDAERIAELANGLRSADRLEVARSAGHDDHAATIAECVDRSTEAYAVIDASGELVAIFGCAPLGSLVSAAGAPWCLGTDLLDRRSRALMSISRRYIHKWRDTYPALVNFVDAENTLSIKFLSALGFKFDAPAPHGPQGALFHRFWQEGTRG